MNDKNIESHKWKKGQSGNLKGRPRKMVSVMKDFGYNKQDVNATIENMMAMTLEELASVYKDELATVLERTVANAIKKSLDKGSLYSIEVLLNRIHGLPKQEVEQKVEAEIKGLTIEIIRTIPIFTDDVQIEHSI